MWMFLLVLFGESVSTAKIYRSHTDTPLPLDMAENSVDDMYEGCENKMATKVKTELLAREKKMSKNFRLAWDEAAKAGKKKPKVLEKEQNMAVYAYTLDKPEIFTEFNNAVRTQRAQYTSTFQYHSLHFFLTGALRALRALNARKPNTERCLTGYRRVNRKFELGVLGKEIRFGAFTSSSMGKYPRKEKFGYETCFGIYTCLGADVSLYSKFGESEGEVLVPPYEIFKVTDIKQRSGNEELPCNVVLTLKSTEKILSNLNCTFH
ncbi:erythroblast NAD(P)(+)--arginine ADP-ribosyltransferase-like [Xiphophorus maculatus]|uniref:erythroblast NAD(P)(+)--arginine ADP-ribosyltransferase-like n=1 Tax=Xiphophorus maculatus TaxID=8083 RepID=UPI0003B6DE9E|nr:erythroblast NAD(P)(+)--arginine ADP-ribosyltransferase-like [Xiphophorus maculatus]